MIRRAVHRRWRRIYHEQRSAYPDGSAMVASFWCLRHWLWIDRYCEWSVATWGGHIGAGPWWERQIVGRFVCWCSDWRTTVALRAGAR